MYKYFFKRVFDVILSILGLVILFIPLVIIAILIYFDLGSPVIFKQERVGKNEKPFFMYKFRSMREAYDEFGIALPDDQRLTKLGRFIRKSSIDELPSLINIIKGDMSIIGPRPLPTRYLPYYTNEERKRHSVRGGLSGLAQVKGRNAVKWDERFKYDIEYVENISMKMDFEIFIETVKVVFKRENVGVRGKDSSIDFDVYRTGKTEHELYGKDYKC